MSKKTDNRWWLSPVKSDVHETVHSFTVTLAKRDGRRDLLRAWENVYADKPTKGSAIDWFIRGARKSRLNVAKNATDAVLARLSSVRPTPKVFTVGGKQRDRQRGAKMTQWLEGENERLEVYRHLETMTKDALKTGTGAVYPHSTYGRPQVDRIWVGDLHCDPLELDKDCVRTMYRTVWVDRAVLIEAYPKHEAGIKASLDPLDEERAGEKHDSAADLVMVVEAYRLPSRNHKGEMLPGRKVICTTGATLIHVDYESERFPWVLLPWSTDGNKPFGTGLVESMAGIQSELNSMTQKISDSYGLMVPSVWVMAGSGVEEQSLNNKPWSIYTYKMGESPPIFHTPSGIAQDFVQREEMLLQRAYELAGISQLSAQSQKPAGLNSGVALATHQDIESERFQPEQRRIEKCMVELAYRLIECAREVHENPDIPQKEKLRTFGGKRMLEAIDFPSDLKDDEYVLRVEPVSQLSRSFSGKLSELKEMIEMQVVTDPGEVRELMSMPDLDRYHEKYQAPRVLADRLIDRAIEGKPLAAHPEMDLDYAIKQTTLRLAIEETYYDDDEDDSHLMHLRQLKGQIEGLIAKRDTPPDPAAGGPPLPPAGMAPELPPQQPGAMGPEIAPAIGPVM